MALAEMCMSGNYGAHIDTLPHPDLTTALFSESTGRFVCEVGPDDLAWFLDGLGEPAIVLGNVTAGKALQLPGLFLRVEALRNAFQADAVHGGAR